jgi:SAM-dependent methyltransferase
MGETFRRSARYYDPYYLRLLDYVKQCDCLEEILTRHGFQGRLEILDIACGTGTHCLELAGRGHRCVGIDISPEMISIANGKAEANPTATNPVFLLQDMRSLQVKGKYDAAICMFGGFGYLNTNEDLSRFLSGLSVALRPGGLFLFEFWNIGGLKETPYRTWRKVEMEGGTYYNLSESNYLPDRGILEISIEHIFTQDEAVADSFIEEHSMRIYSLPEIRGVLSNNGYSLLEAFDESHLESSKPPSRDTFRIFAVARLEDRPGSGDGGNTAESGR